MSVYLPLLGILAGVVFLTTLFALRGKQPKKLSDIDKARIIDAANRREIKNARRAELMEKQKRREDEKVVNQMWAKMLAKKRGVK